MAVARLGYEIDSSGAVVAADNLDDMAAAAKRAEVGAKKVGAGMAGAGVNMRMLVPQLSQIGQQFTATGQLGQAVAVQAADIGLAFGVVGTVIGTVAGVALPSLIDALGEGESAADRLTDASDRLGDTMGALEATSQLVLDDMDTLTKRYGDQAAAVRALFRELVAVNKQQALNAAQATIIAAQDQFNDLERSLRDFADRRRELLRAQDVDAETIAGVLPSEMRRLQGEVEAAAQAIADDFNLTTAQAFRIVDALNAVEKAAGPEEAAQAAAGLASAIASAADEGAQLSSEMANVASSAAQAFAAVQEVIQTGTQTQFAPGLNPTMDIPGMLPPNRRRGGGGSRVDPFARDLERLRESLRTEREVIEEWRAEQDALLADRRAMEILGIEGHNEAKLRLEQEYQDRLAGIREDGNRFGLESALSGGAEMLGAMGAFNKKALKLQAVFAAGSALISTYQGAAKELEKGTLGFATAAAVIAKGLAFVSAIKSAGSGSTSAGSGSSAGITATSSAPQVQQTRAIISVQGGRSRFTVEEFDDIIRELQDRSDEGVIIEGFARG